MIFITDTIFCISFFYYTGNNEEKKSVHEELEKLALDDEPDTRLGQGTLSFNEAHGVHSQAGAHISKVLLCTVIAEANIWGKCSVYIF